MLEDFGLTKKILSFNGDNATVNDKLTKKLASLDNSFEECNRVRCFNHTLQLSAKALVQPFNAGMSSAHNATLAGDQVEDDNEDDDCEEINMDGVDNNDDEDDDNDDDDDDAVDELEMLSEEEREEILNDTAIVRQTVTKVSKFSH
jgi:hypothetical protein